MANTKKKTLDKEGKNKKVIFTMRAWEDYQYWREEDPAKFGKINELIASAQDSLHIGLGKPEKLSGNLKGYYSRRIDSKHRLVYKGDGGDLVIVMAKYHY